MLNIPFMIGTSPEQGASSPITGFMPIILIFIIFYFLLIRPQQRQRRAHEEMIGRLKKGDQVVTNGGIHGLVVGVKEKTLILKVADGVKIELQRNAISYVKKETGAPEK